MQHAQSSWFFWLVSTSCLLLEVAAGNGTVVGHGAVHLPITYGRPQSQHSRRTVDGQVAVGGLGDYEDIAYSVLVKLGTTSVPLLLDTGSADLWAISDSCPKNCSHGLPTFPHKKLNYSGVDARLFYGDSFNGQYAFGPIGSATVQLANISIAGQYFAAINNTDTTTVSTLSVGLLGLGFPESSAIWNALFNHQYPTSAKTTSTTTSSTHSPSLSTSTPIRRARPLSSRSIPRLSEMLDLTAGMQSLATVDQLLKTFITYGPLVARMSFSGLLRSPSFTVTLQRDTVDVGGNAGLLSLGELPPGVSNSSLTWAPVRPYTVQQGGIPPSPAAPNETYSLFWEIPIDNVYLDGSVLPQSTLSTGVSLTALIDTGSSLLRGPADVVADIYKQISGDETSATYDCSAAHVLEFEIAGTKFPLDPRDFGWQAFPGSLQHCNASVVATDPPSKGFLYAWQLGVPFLKSVLTSFYYGNLTNPSVDPPRIGLVSTMPSNAKDLLASAIKAAGSNFPAIIESAPSTLPNFTASGIAGVALAPTHSLPISTSTLITSTSSQVLGSSTSSPAPTTSTNHGASTLREPKTNILIASIVGLYLCFG